MRKSGKQDLRKGLSKVRRAVEKGKDKIRIKERIRLEGKRKEKQK